MTIYKHEIEPSTKEMKLLDDLKDKGIDYLIEEFNIKPDMAESMYDTLRRHSDKLYNAVLDTSRQDYSALSEDERIDLFDKQMRKLATDVSLELEVIASNLRDLLNEEEDSAIDYLDDFELI